MRNGPQTSAEERRGGDGPGQAVEPRSGTSRPSRRRVVNQGRNWLTEPKTAVLLVVGGVLLVGGGRRLFRAWQTRKVLARLAETDATPEEIVSAARFGRAGLMELFQILTESPTQAQREAAGRAISVLWARDDLVAEEEQALVRRGFAAEWHARRRYPRALRSPIPIAVSYGVSFFQDEGPGIHAENLEWSHRLTGARRAALEDDSPWTSGPGRFSFSVIPGDFDAHGPHRLVLQTRVRTRGLTDSWWIELPHLPFHFEFDPRLEVSALLTLADASRGEQIAHSVRLERQEPGADQPSRFLDLNTDFTIRDPPCLVVATPLSCDLAHQAYLEIDAVEGRFAAGSVVVAGQGMARRDSLARNLGSKSLPIGPVQPVPREVLDRPGPRCIRLVLEADPDLGWTDPEVRSIWPGTISTDWIEVEVIRR